jgi:CheY-like chemotaxis protein
VLLASDGHNALRQLEASTNLPDLIISDISMPTMDGFQFFEEVRRHDEWMGIPFLFLPARDQIDDLKRRYSLGADDCPGIPEEELKRMFVEPYDQSNRERYEGPHIAIGLTLARGIIKAHGGTLELNSVVCKGTQAFVGLPMHNSEEF